MLNKDICIHCACVESYVNGHTVRIPEDREWAVGHPWRWSVCGHKMLTNPPSGWREEDDENWQNGSVHCPMEHSDGKQTRIDQPPPAHCPYPLEHVMSKPCA
jgi:hypothetical protein